MFFTHYRTFLVLLVITSLLVAPASGLAAVSPGRGSSVGERPINSRATVRIFLTSGTSWSVPADWDSSNNTIECIGAGGTTINSDTATPSTGGGGGAYAKITNLSLTPGNSVSYVVATGGSQNDTYFNGAASTSASLSCAGGKNGAKAISATGGKGGAAIDSTGTVKYDGGDGGGTLAKGGGGGGGSAGPSGVGNAGGLGSNNNSSGGGGGGSNGGSSTAGADGVSPGGNGGAGTSGTGGGLGATTNPGVGGDGSSGGGGGGGNGTSSGTSSDTAGGAGSMDTSFDATHGASGGGGGGSGSSGSGNQGGSGGDGGTYGGGGGGPGRGGSTGGGGVAGAAGQGIIVISYLGSPGSSYNPTVYITTTGAGTWTVPSDWNSARNTIEVIGGGGGGGRPDQATFNGSSGGAGGGYSKITNLVLTPGATVSYSVGIAGAGASASGGTGGTGGDTWFGATSLANCVSAGSASCVGAKGGTGGTGAAGLAVGVGGAAGSGVGTTKYSGGNGGAAFAHGASPNDGGGGGGGAAGPNGNGGVGGNGGDGGVSGTGNSGGGGGGANGGGAGAAASASTPGAGGTNRTGVGGGSAGAVNGGTGTSGGGGGGGDNGATAGTGGTGSQETIWSASGGVGPGGGGGGGGSANTSGTGGVGGNAGGYGGGGGGGGNATASRNGGSGTQGIIVINYNSLNTAKQVSKNLVSYWPLDGNQTNWSTGQVNDVSGEGYHGRVVAMSTTTSPAVGKIGQAMSFDGVNDYISFTGPNLANSSFTVSSWIFINSIPATSNTWFSLGSAGSTNTGLHLRVKAGGGVRMGFFSNDLNTDDNLVLPGGWHHIVATYNVADGARKIYYDGSVVASETGAAAFTGDTVGTIGKVSYTAGEYFAGKVDDLRIYNFALSQSEVDVLFGTGKATVNKAKRIFLTDTAQTQWKVPADWNSSNNTIEVIGGGGRGAGNTPGGGGGGGGGYSKISNLALTPGATVTYQVGTGSGTAGVNGADTYFNGTGTTCAAQSVCAKGGATASGSGAGAGGAAGSGVGTVKYSGGTGGAVTVSGGGGGGGAAGPRGNGGDGGDANGTQGGGGGAGGGGGVGSNATSAVGGNGGNNYLGYGGGTGGNGGAGTVGYDGGGGGGGDTGQDSGAGGRGQEWDQLHGAGGGGGGIGHDFNAAAGSGGLYGGGGGSKGDDANGSSGPGVQGIIVITYTPTVLAYKTIFLTSGSGTQWTVPSDWNSASNIIEVIGGGADGDGNSGTANGGGGGGAYSKILNLTLTPGATVIYRVGAGHTGGSGVSGGDTFFNRTAGSANTCADTSSVCAKGGIQPNGAASGTGGAAGSGIGTIKYSGGNGGLGQGTRNGAGGGGGAAGPNGAGGNGGDGSNASNGSGGGGGGANGGSAGSNAPSDTASGAGGNNRLGTGGGASVGDSTAGNPGTNGGGGSGGDGTASNGFNGGAGSMDAIWISSITGATAGPGSGGGAGGGSGSGVGEDGGNGGDGGDYGGGGGGAGDNGNKGQGQEGIIIIRYQPTKGSVTIGASKASLVSSGLVGYWPFDGKYVNWAKGVVSDISGQGNNGSLVNMSTSSSPVPGKTGQALNFDGVDDYISFTSPSFSNASFSVAGWVYENDASANRAWFTVGSSGTANNALHMQADSTGAVSMRFFSNNLISSTGIFTPNAWHHIVGTYNVSNGARKIYLDGVEVASETGVAAFTGDTVGNIGRKAYDGTARWSGKIDDVRLYNRALTYREIQALYSGTK